MPTTPTCSTTATTRARTTGAGRVRRPGHRDPCLRRRSRPAGLSERLGSLSAMTHESAVRDATSRACAAARGSSPRWRAAGLACGRRPALHRSAGARLTRLRGSASCAPPGSAGAARHPIFNLTTEDRLHQPPGRQHRVHVGLLQRVRRLPAPRSGPLRQRGRHGDGDPAQHPARGLLDRLPRPEGRARRREAGTAAGQRRRHDDLADRHRRRRRRDDHLQLRRRPTPAPTSTSPAPTPRSRSGWACSGR